MTDHVELLAWDAARRQLVPLLQLCDGREHRWIEYPQLRGRDFGGRIIAVPADHASAVFTCPADAVLLGVRGTLEVTVEGAGLQLGKLDLLRVRAGSGFSVKNIGNEPGLLVLLTSTKPAGTATEASPASTHMLWRDYHRDFAWNLPLAEQFGFHRGSGPYIGADGLRGHTVRMPIGQTTPWHHVPRDILFMPLEGSVDFHCGGQRWNLGPLDMLMVPAGTPYRYQNCGLEEVFFLSTGGGVVEQVRSTYYLSDPGWPPSAETPTLQTSRDVYGNARMAST